MPEKINATRPLRSVTPEQQDYRGHTLFDRRTGQKKAKYIRRLMPQTSGYSFSSEKLDG